RPYPAAPMARQRSDLRPVLAAGALTLLAFALRFLAARQSLTQLRPPRGSSARCCPSTPRGTLRHRWEPSMPEHRVSTGLPNGREPRVSSDTWKMLAFAGLSESAPRGVEVIGALLLVAAA